MFSYITLTYFPRDIEESRNEFRIPTGNIDEINGSGSGGDSSSSVSQGIPHRFYPSRHEGKLPYLQVAATGSLTGLA